MTSSNSRSGSFAVTLIKEVPMGESSRMEEAKVSVKIGGLSLMLSTVM